MLQTEQESAGEGEREGEGEAEKEAIEPEIACYANKTNSSESRLNKKRLCVIYVACLSTPDCVR